MNNQLFGIGTRVKFLTTPDKGVIVDKLGSGMVMVLLDDVDMEIPAFEEDLVREEFFMQNIDNQYFNTNKSKTNARIKDTNNTNIPVESKSLTFTNSGILLTFLPQLKSSGEIENLDIVLLNDSPVPILFEMDFVLFGEIEWSKEGKLNSSEIEKLGTIPFDDINESPEFDMAISPIYTEGVGEKRVKTLKIKVKQFLKNHTLLKALDKEAYVFVIVENFKNDASGEKDIESYTKEILKNKLKTKEDDLDIVPYNTVSNVNEFALFEREIDLHIELLHDNPSRLTNNEIVAIQLKAFESYIQKAIRLGISKVFIIHGVGKGKLKEMIHAKLRRNSDVRHFKNEYNEKYGWGATEVIIDLW